MTMGGSRKKIRLNDNIVGEHSVNNNATSEVLNDDCLLHIFNYLPICDKVRLERVNKRWCAVSQMSWQSCKTLTFTNDLWGCQSEEKVTKKALRKVLRLCGRFLKVLDLSKSEVLEEKIDMSSLLNFCPNLTSVDLTSVKVGVPLIKSLVEHCKNIVKLCIRETTHFVTGVLIGETVLSTYTNLQVLKMESIHFFCHWIKFGNNDSIEELCLENCLGMCICNLEDIIPQLQNLHTLSLRGSLDMSECPAELYFTTLSNLKSLDISDNPRVVDDNFLIEAAGTCRYLKSLMVGDNYKVTDEGLRAVISSCKLEFLDIDNLIMVTGNFFSDLPNLVGLSCQDCNLIKAEQFQSLFNTSDRLVFIDLKSVELAHSIIRIAVNYVNSRAKDTELHMFVDEDDHTAVLADIPENLIIYEYDDDQQ